MKFYRVTGIKESDWSGRYWARWSDALAEAGYPPNALQGPLDELDLLRSLVEAIDSLGKWPTSAELRLYGRSVADFPSHNTFRRLGSKLSQARAILTHSDELGTPTQVLAICEAITASYVENSEPSDRPTARPKGSVYLVRSGRFHKIGHANDTARRAYELRLLLPEKVIVVHQIETDDPVGIEAYWHRRLADRRANGEWFSLTADDIAAFKARKSM